MNKVKEKNMVCPSPENPCMCGCHPGAECWECRMGRHKPMTKNTKPVNKLAGIKAQPKVLAGVGNENINHNKYKEVDEEFDKLDYLFHGVEDGDYCMGDTIKVPIKVNDTGGERIVGYKIEEGQCFCEGEKNKLKVLDFLHQQLDKALNKERESNISLCPNCNCMTHKICGKCGLEKALDKRDKEWEAKISTLLRGDRAKRMADNLEIYSGRRHCVICGSDPEKMEEYVKSLLKH